MAVKITKDIWIERCRKHHADKFDYSNTDFINLKQTRVTVRCPVHGEITVNSDGHMRGEGCYQCVYGPEKGQSLGDVFPRSIEEWHSENKHTPFYYKPHSHQQVKWICKDCSHVFTKRIGYRTSQRNRKRTELAQCPSCIGREVHLDGRNSLANKFCEIAEEFDMNKNLPLTPRAIVSGSHKSVWWICKICVHEWKQMISVRTGQQVGCPACSNHSIHINESNSLSALHPELANRFHPTKNSPKTANTVVGSGAKPYWWLCDKCDNEYKSQINVQIESANWSSNGCTYCSKGYLHSDGRNSLLESYPELAKEFHSTKNGPNTIHNIVGGTYKKLWWQCLDCTHEWQATGDKRSKMNRGCPVCCITSEVVRPDGQNSISTLFPQIASEFHSTKNGTNTIFNIKPTSGKKILWICNSCDWEWIQAPNIRTGSMKTGCPKCALPGFQPHLPGYYYCFSYTGPDGEVWWYKGGISSEPERRKQQLLNSLKKVKLFLDIDLVEQIWFEEGVKAQDLETKLLGEKSIRVSTFENISGRRELFSINPIQYAREQKWIDE
jgi:hypothetical protein